MIRQVKVAKAVAVKARTAAIISLKLVIVNAPPEPREELQPLTKSTIQLRVNQPLGECEAGVGA